MAAAGPFGMSMGTVMGSTRRGPRSRSVSYASRSVHTPPMPVAQSIARRSGSTSGAPASCQASRPAMSANWLEGSSRFVSTRSRTSADGTAAWAANVTGSWCFSTHSYSRVRAPETPARRFCQVSLAVPPSGVVAPIPVTTMRLVMW